VDHGRESAQERGRIRGFLGTRTGGAAPKKTPGHSRNTHTHGGQVFMDVLERAEPARPLVRVRLRFTKGGRRGEANEGTRAPKRRKESR